MKNILRLTLALLALVLCVGLFASCDKGVSPDSVKADPHAALEEANRKYLDALTARYGNAFKVFDKISEGTGTHTVELSIPDIADASLNVVADASTGAYNGSLSVGSQGISAEAKLWGDKNNIAVSLPALLGDGSYGVKLDTFEDDVKASPLLEAMGVSYDELIDSLETEMGVSIDDLKEMLDTARIKSAYEKYISDTEAITKELPAAVGEETVDGVETITVQYTVTKETAEKLIGTMTEMYETMFGKLFDAAGTDMEEFSDEMSSALDEFGADMTVKSYIVKESGQLLKTEAVKGEEMSITANYSSDLSKPLDMTIDMSVTADGESVGINLVVKETADEGMGGIYADAKVSISADGETEEHTAGMSFITNDSTDEYDIEITADGETLAGISGKLSYSDTEFCISMNSISADGETVDIDLSYSAKAEGTVEAVPEYSNIITMSLEELQTLILNISSSDLGGLLSMGSEDESYDEDYYYDEDFGYSDDVWDEYYDETYDWDEYYETYEWDTDDWYFDTEEAEDAA